MSYSLLIGLVIILGCISHSYGIHVRSNDLQRERRDSDVSETAQQAADTLAEGEQEFEEEIKQTIDKTKEEIENICKKVMKATNDMAALGTQDTSCVGQWEHIQDGLRDGIHLVIKAYRKYIKVQREICESIETFANDVIDKYEDELSAIDRMSAPSDVADVNSGAWKQFASRFQSKLNYAGIHYRTLPVAADCTADLMTRTLQLRQVIMRKPPVSQTSVIYIAHPAAPQYAPQRVAFHCDTVAEDNGCQACGRSLAVTTRDWANVACGRCI